MTIMVTGAVCVCEAATPPRHLRQDRAVPEDRVSPIDGGFTSLAAVARGFADYAGAELRMGPPYPQNCGASTDSFRDRHYRTSWAQQPAAKCLNFSAKYLQIARDHLYGMATVLDAGTSLLSAQSIGRTVLLASANSFWILDEEVDIGERIRRTANLDLLEIFERLMFLDDLDADATAIMMRWRSAALELSTPLGVTVGQPRLGSFRAELRWLGEAVPREMVRCRLVCGSGPGDDELGAMAYRIGSAAAHGQTHSLMTIREVLVPGEAGGRPVKQWQAKVKDTASAVVGAIFAFHTASKRMLGYCGTPPQRWDELTMPLLMDLRRLLLLTEPDR